MNATERAALIDRYAAGPALLRATVAKVPADAMKWRPAAGKWSAHEVVVHCTDSETTAASRLRYLLAEKEPVLVGYDQDVWARDLDYHAQPLDLALAVVDAVRANTAHLLRRLPPEAFAKTGRHTEVGAYSVEKWLTYYADHLHVHAAQIERNLAAFAAKR
jgi:DinB family protein